MNETPMDTLGDRQIRKWRQFAVPLTASVAYLLSSAIGVYIYYNPAPGCFNNHFWEPVAGYLLAILIVLGALPLALSWLVAGVFTRRWTRVLSLIVTAGGSVVWGILFAYASQADYCNSPR